MPDSIAPIKIGKEWVNVNSLSGIAAGTAITIESVGAGVISTATKTTQPTVEKGAQIEKLGFLSVPSGESSVWAKCSVDAGEITVQEG